MINVIGLATVLALTACGDPGPMAATDLAPPAQTTTGTASCTTMAGSITTCGDISGLLTSQTNYKTACMQAGGTAGSGCSHIGAVGGCRSQANGISSTTWFYAPTYTAAMVMQSCSQTLLTYVAP
jgi:hypothetical protein